MRLVGKHTEIGISNPAEMHVLLHFESLVARLCITAVGGNVWKQTGPIMVSLNDCKFVSNQLGKASIGCSPRSFGMSSLLFDCSDWVYIRLSNTFSSLWDNHKFLSRLRLNVCFGFVPCLINKGGHVVCP